MKRLELVHEGDDIELKYFEDETDRYRSWKLSKYLINRIIPWYNKIRISTQKYPLVERTEFFEFKIDNLRDIKIKEFENNVCIGSYDIPMVLIVALAEMEKEGLTSKKI